jgi:hypothetical protein
MTHITIERAKLEQVLEALELNNAEWKAMADSGDCGYWHAEERDHYIQTEKAITAIKALPQPNQAPCDMGVMCAGCTPRNSDNSCPAAQPEQEHHEFPLRGLLASELKCWHRLTEDEQINLLAFVKNTTPPAAQPEQEPVAWPCLIAEADFSQNTVTLAMQCEDYKVSAGQHWLYTTPPAQPAQRKPLTNGEIYTAYVEAANQTLRPQDERIAFAFARAIEAAHGIKENT